MLTYEQRTHTFGTQSQYVFMTNDDGIMCLNSNQLPYILYHFSLRSQVNIFFLTLVSPTFSHPIYRQVVESVVVALHLFVCLALYKKIIIQKIMYGFYTVLL